MYKTNPIKYSTATQSGALRKGNLHLGVTDKDYGPTINTGYYSGINFETGYVSYIWLGDGITYHVSNTDQDLISFLSNRSGFSFSSLTQSIMWSSTQSDLMIINKKFESLQTDGLSLYLDASFLPSYPRSGNTWYSLGNSGNNATLANGTTYNTQDGGVMFFDGSNDTIILDNETNLTDWSISYWQRLDINQNTSSVPTLFYSLPQSGWGTPGYITNFVGIFTHIGSIAIDSSDNIYVGGQYGGYDDVVRDTLVKINPNGSPNTQFNSGFGITNAGVVTINKIHILSNGNLVTVGTNIAQGGIALYNSTSGVYIPSLSWTNQFIAQSFIIDETSNSMWILDPWYSTYQSQNVQGKIFKVNLTNFNIDPNFNSATGFKSAVGKITTSNNEGVVDGIVLQDGNLLCVGYFMEYKGVTASRIVKINSNTGELDTSFVYGSGFNSTTNGAVQMDNATIVVVGQFTSYNGTSANRIIGLNNDGSIDTDFNIGSGFNGTVNSVIYDPVNNKLFCFGAFTSYKGTSANRIVKLNSDGSIDTSFNYGTGFNNTTNTGALDSQGRLVVIWNEVNTTYQGQTTPRRICRINPNGSLDTSFNSGGFNIDRFRNDTLFRLNNNTEVYMVGLFGNGNREIINLSNGLMDFNGLNNYTITFNGNTKTITGYLNGVLKATLTVGDGFNLKSKTLGFFNNISNISIYNKVLSEQEVKQNHVSKTFEFFRHRVNSDGGTLLTSQVDSNMQNALKYNPSFVNLGNAIKQNKLYSLKPIDDAGSGDFTFSRSSSATIINKDGIIEVVGNNMPRINYPIGGSPGILIEPQRTNLFTWSEDQSNWLQLTGTIINNQTDPNGTTNAQKIIITSDGCQIGKTDLSLPASTGGLDYTISFYAKSDDLTSGGLKY